MGTVNQEDNLTRIADALERINSNLDSISSSLSDVSVSLYSIDQTLTGCTRTYGNYNVNDHFLCIAGNVSTN